MSMLKRCSILMLALIAFSPLDSALAQTSKTYRGFLVDRACAAMYKHDGGNIAQKVASHTRSCCLEPSCSEAGYSLYVTGDQAWYDLDNKGNEMARALIKKSKVARGNKVQITGEIKRGELRTSAVSEI